MEFGHFSYLISILVFLGLPTLALSRIYRGFRPEIAKYKDILVIVGVVGLLMAIPDYAALKWGAWYYDPQHTLGLIRGAEPETYLGALLIFVLGAGATIVCAAKEDERARDFKPKQIRKWQLSLPRMAFAGSAAAKR